MRPFKGSVAGQQRREKSKIFPPTPSRCMGEWLSILLLLSGAIAGPILFGAVRLWSFGGLALLVCIGSLLAFLLTLKSEKREWLFAPPGGYVWAVFLLYLLFRIPFSPIPYEARIEFLKIASLFAAYWAWMTLLDRPGRWRLLSAAVLLVGAGICLYAFIQQTRDQIMVWNIVGKYGRRASGTYVCPNHFAAYLEILVCFAAALLLTKSSGWPLRIFAVYGIINYLPAIYLSQSRSGWIGTITGLSVVALLFCWRKSTKLFLAMLAIIPVILVALSVTAWHMSPMVRERITGFIRPPEPESDAPFNIENCRLYFWQDTLSMIGDAPVFGHGGGAYRYVFPRYMTKVFPRYVRYAHNDYLHHIAEYGIVGLLLFAAIVIVGAIKYLRWIKRTQRDKNAGLAIGLLGALAAAFSHCMFDYNLQYFSNNHVLVLIAAIAASSFYASGDFEPKKLARPLLVWLPAAIAILLMIAVWIPTLLSYGYALQAKNAEEKLEWEQAQNEYERALKYDPGNWKAYLGLGRLFKNRGIWELDAEMQQQMLADSREYYNLALEGNPYAVEANYGISSILDKQGKDAEALQMLEEITQKFPGHVFYKIRYGLALKEAGEYSEALEVFKEARRLAPEESQNRTIQLNIKYLRKRL